MAVDIYEQITPLCTLPLSSYTPYPPSRKNSDLHQLYKFASRVTVIKQLLPHTYVSDCSRCYTVAMRCQINYTNDTGTLGLWLESESKLAGLFCRELAMPGWLFAVLRQSTVRSVVLLRRRWKRLQRRNGRVCRIPRLATYNMHIIVIAVAIPGWETFTRWSCTPLWSKTAWVGYFDTVGRDVTCSIFSLKFYIQYFNLNFIRKQ